MKFAPRLLLPSFALLLAWTAPSSAQNTDASGPDAPPPGSTVITSDELRSDQNTHISVFTGKVNVVGSNFTMTCNEMTVYFDKAGKVDHIVSTGNVVITQPGRITHSGQAEYFKDEDKFILTQEPTILDSKNQLSAPKIIIYRTDQKLQTEGGHSTMILGPDSGPGATSPAPPAPDNK